MGVSQEALFVSVDDLVAGNNNRGNNGNSSSRNLLSKIRRRSSSSSSSSSSWQGRKQQRRPFMSSRTRRYYLMKRMGPAHVEEGSRRPTKIQRKVRTLKKLVPNSSESMGLDGLFRETADHILDLQMRVNLMQLMLKSLSPATSD